MRRRMRSEDGVALTVAMFTLAVIALFSALIASTAGQLGDTSNQDRDSKRALGAAEAGINTALHRLNTAATPLDNLQCFTDVQVGVLGTATPYPGIETEVGGQLTLPAGSCPGASGRTGNDGTYTYWVTLLNNGQHCDEQYTTATEVSNLLALGVGGISVLRRCVTSIGVVNGVQRRLQREIYSEFRLFKGLIGTGPVTARNLANLGTSHVGSNELVTMDAGSLYGGQVEVYDDAPEPVMNATGVWGVTRRADPWILDPVRVSNTTSNTGGISCRGPLILVPCGSGGGYQSTGDRVIVPTGYTVTFGGGNYYLCQLSVTGGTLVVSAQTRIFIDDCGTAPLVIQGGLVNATGVVSAANLQVYVEGDSAVNISGGTLAQANITLYAPESAVTVEKGSGLLAPVVKGSISAQSIELKQGVTFVGDALLDITTPFEQIAGEWHAGNWSECPAKPESATDPHSGCNG